MLSIVVATHDSERALVATLAALVPGATAGIVREVIIADGGSTDETEQVADIAGCSFLQSGEPLGVRLKAAAARARGTWLMFMRPGAVPAPGWVDDTTTFIEQTERAGRSRAAVFTMAEPGFRALIRRAFGFLPAPDQGLILQKAQYEQIGGHRSVESPDTDLLRRIGRRQITALRTTITKSDI